MVNQSVIVGRLTKDPELKELESGKNVCNLQLAVSRSYKNAEGVYDTDFIDCTLWQGVAQNVTEYCKKGDMLAVKGRLETQNFEVDGENRKKMYIVGEQVSYLTSKAKETENDKDDEMEV